jgi:CubicO group peptidase (beta-lactamase class C family)
MKKLGLILLLSSGFLVHAEEGSNAKASVLDHPDVKGALAITDAWIDGIRAYENVPGISVGFVFDQDLIFGKGYGFANVRRKIPADADTIYSICSISKLFTSIGVMQMRDAGKLTLRDRVDEHLEWFNVQEAHADDGPTRIHGLLTHSSGLPRESDFPYWSDPNHPFPTRAEMIEQLQSQETLYPADSLFQYSNLGLTLAGELVRHHAGTSYEDYVHDRILSPLGMSDTRPFFPEELHGRQLAIGYAGRQRDWKRKPLKPFHTRSIAPAAGFTSTVNDLAKFASWNFRTLDGTTNEVLAPNTLRQMQRVQWVDPDWKTTWGLGFIVAKTDAGNAVGHGGACPGYITSFMMVPKHKTAAIALTNAADGPAAKITQNMLRVVGPALVKAKTPATSEGTAALAKYEGRYGGSIWGGELVIRAWGDQLASTQLPSDQLEVVKVKHEEGDVFVRITDDGDERERWYFQADATGRITGVKIHGSIASRLD